MFIDNFVILISGEEDFWENVLEDLKEVKDIKRWRVVLT